MSSELPSTRDRLCESAIRIAARDGILAMTLDNVAKEAGVSKGGVMYHFRTKDELVQAMLRHFGERLEAMLTRKVADDPNPNHRWARAFVDCVFPAPEVTASSPSPAGEGLAFTPEIIDQFLLATITATINAPALLEPLRQTAQRFRDRMLADSESGMDQLLTWLALDGLFLWQFVGLINRQDPLFHQVGEAIRQRLAARGGPAEGRS